MNLPAQELAIKRKDALEDINKHWRVEDELVNDGRSLYLARLKILEVFELLIDYKTVPSADSGIYLEAIPQVQIWDTTEAGGKWRFDMHGSGGLWNNRQRKSWSSRHFEASHWSMNQLSYNDRKM